MAYRFAFDEDRLKALLLLADIPVLRIESLPNGYWPDVPEYQELRQSSPWFLVHTPFGPIQIGWRKRVLALSWEGTSVRQEVTTDEVTRSDTDVHAWTYAKALEYLTELKNLAYAR